MKKTLLILSAIAVSGTAFVIAQEGERPAPRGDRAGRGGPGMFANAPFFKAMKMGEDGSVALPKTDDEKADFLKAIAKCDTNGNGKLERVEMFGEMRRGGGAGGSGAGGGARRPGGEGGADAPKTPASE
jgi:hypothetical protein